MSIKKKFILGTAQFSGNYGILSNNISIGEIKKIFSYLKKNKMYVLDTSTEYKKADRKIGKSLKSSWKVITKIDISKFYTKESNQIEKFIINKLNKHKKNLKVKSIDTLLTHKSECLLKKRGRVIYNVLKKLKNKNYFKKFGYSIYSFNDFEKISNSLKPDIIQCPYNVFDRRLENKKILYLIKSNKIKIHVRSVFLQGLLLLNVNNIPKKLKVFRNKFQVWNNWLTLKNLDPITACLNFVLKNRNIDKIVIGVNSFRQLKQILETKNQKKIFFPKTISVNNLKLLNPSKW